MANLKISELPVLSTITNDSPFAVVDLGGPTTSQVTITGMTWQGGAEYLDALAGTYDIANPYVLNTSGTSILFTGFTQQTKRYEANCVVSVTLVYSMDSISNLNYCYIDVDAGSTTPNFLLPDAGGSTWTSSTFIWRAPNLSAGSHTVDLYINVENGINMSIAQVILSFQEL